eukprot:TRINITY_DN11645_c0_g1_i1.p1 TRINITY_DN11645_c0_g1~~TRINITY_DN11645_c0_g1_i1.p1  ORF type:complete len:201 (-),score=-27.08 TRINITY_DN11645_c0_g1_i1:87-689(-)
MLNYKYNQNHNYQQLRYFSIISHNNQSIPSYTCIVHNQHIKPILHLLLLLCPKTITINSPRYLSNKQQNTRDTKNLTLTHFFRSYFENLTHSSKLNRYELRQRWDSHIHTYIHTNKQQGIAYVINVHMRLYLHRGVVAFFRLGGSLTVSPYFMVRRAWDSIFLHVYRVFIFSVTISFPRIRRTSKSTEYIKSYAIFHTSF